MFGKPHCQWSQYVERMASGSSQNAIRRKLAEHFKIGALSSGKAAPNHLARNQSGTQTLTLFLSPERVNTGLHSIRQLQTNERRRGNLFTNTMELESLSLPPNWLLWAALVIGIIASLKIARALTVDLSAPTKKSLKNTLTSIFPPSNRKEQRQRSPFRKVPPMKQELITLAMQAFFLARAVRAVLHLARRAEAQLNPQHRRK